MHLRLLLDGMYLPMPMFNHVDSERRPVASMFSSSSVVLYHKPSVLDLRLKGPGFESHWHHWVVSLSKTH